MLAKINLFFTTLMNHVRMCQILYVILVKNVKIMIV